MVKQGIKRWGVGKKLVFMMVLYGQAVVMESTMRSLQLLKTPNYGESDQLVLAFEFPSLICISESGLSIVEA